MFPFITGSVNRFRTSFTHKEGLIPSAILKCKVTDVNLTNWTVDAVSTFDRKRYLNIQVGTPYVHYNSGEGVYVTPEIGAVCYVCVPSDSTPPFVLSFIMPHSLVDSGTEDAPQGTASEKGSTQKYATDASFSGGRPQAKPGDINMQTRDGNFITLHRGGVLQIGSNEMTQRVYIPLGNLIMDMSGSYAHHNTSGSILWGVQEGLADNSLPSLYTHTFRVRANDNEADVRVRVGEIRSPLGEPPEGDQENLEQLEIGNNQKKNPIICEVAVSKTGFVTNSGDNLNADTVKNSVLRFFFDRAGGTFLRCSGSLMISTKKKLYIKAKEEITLEGKSVLIKLTDGAEINGGSCTHIKGEIVRLSQGAAPIARQGDIVTVVVPPGIIPVQITGITAAQGSPIVATGLVMGGQLVGTITSGNSRVLA